MILEPTGGKDLVMDSKQDSCREGFQKHDNTESLPLLELPTVDGKTSRVEYLETRQNGYQWYVALCQTTRFATRIQNARPKPREVVFLVFARSWLPRIPQLMNALQKSIRHSP